MMVTSEARMDFAGSLIIEHILHIDDVTSECFQLYSYDSSDNSIKILQFFI